MKNSTIELGAIALYSNYLIKSEASRMKDSVLRTMASPRVGGGVGGAGGYVSDPSKPESMPPIPWTSLTLAQRNFYRAEFVRCCAEFEDL